MGQVLHGSAQRRRRSVERYSIVKPVRSLSKGEPEYAGQRHGINQKTVVKWKKRTAVKDLPTGPKDAHSTVLSIEEEAVIIAFHRRVDHRVFQVRLVRGR